MNNQDIMQKRRAVLRALGTGIVAGIAGCSQSDQEQTTTESATSSGTPTGTGTPTGPDSGLFGESAFAYPRHGETISLMSGQYAPDFEAPDALEERNSYTYTEPDLSNDVDSNNDYTGGISFDDGTAFIAGGSVQRIEYDGTETWESGSESSINGGVAVGEDVVVISTPGRLVGYNRESGDEEWIREGGIPLTAEDGYLFHTSEGSLTKSNLDTGEQDWVAEPAPESPDSNTVSNYAIPGEDDRLIRFTSDYVIAQIKADENQLASGVDEQFGLVAIDRESGDIVWTTTEYDYKFTEAVLANGQFIAHQGFGGYFRAFSVDTGDETFDIEYDYEMPDYPRSVGHLTTNGEKLFTRSDEAVLAYNLDDGTLAWESLMPSAPTTGIACTDDTVYSVVNGQIRRIDASSGEQTGQYDASVGDVPGLFLVGDHILTLTVSSQQQDDTGEVTLYAAPE